MSAFIVQDRTINRIVTFLAIDREGDYLRRQIQKETGCDLVTREGKEALSAAMFALNVRAVNERYGDGEAEQFRPLDYKYNLDPHTSRMQAYKSLRCWLYQCMEGSVPSESLLYSTMDRVAAEMAEIIVSRLPEYDAARWD